MAGYEDALALLIAIKTDSQFGSETNTVEPEEIRTWMAQKGLADCDSCYFVNGDINSGGFAVWDKFKNANSDLYITAGIPMVIDKTMAIREISGTYEWEDTGYPLSTILECLEE